MAMKSRRAVLLVLMLLVALSVLCFFSGAWLQCLIFISHVATICLDEICRVGGLWTRWAAGLLILVLVSEIVLYTRMRHRRRFWVAFAIGITAIASATITISAMTCQGPSTAWWDPIPRLPCWSQICPGQTTDDNVLTMLQARGDINPQSIRFYDYDTFNTIDWDFSSKHQGTGVAYFVGGRLLALELCPRGVTLGGAVEKFGEPELFVARSGSADTRWRSVLLLYPEQGVLVSGYDVGHWNPQNGNERLEEGMPVNRIVYFKAGTVDDLLIFPSVLSTGVRDFQPWRGFGLVPYLQD